MVVVVVVVVGVLHGDCFALCTGTLASHLMSMPFISSHLMSASDAGLVRGFVCDVYEGIRSVCAATGHLQGVS